MIMVDGKLQVEVHHNVVPFREALSHRVGEEGFPAGEVGEPLDFLLGEFDPSLFLQLPCCCFREVFSGIYPPSLEG